MWVSLWLACGSSKSTFEQDVQDEVSDTNSNDVDVDEERTKKDRR